MGEMPLNFEIHVLPKLEITVNRDTADLVAGHIDLSVNRDVRSFVVEAYGMDGMPIEAASHFMGAVAGTQTVPLEWTPSTHDVLRFRVRVEDGSGFWAEKNLYPWFFEIPHEDVVFATNESTIRSSEMGKLREPWEAIQETAARYSGIAPVNLFISGYTDTVGSRSSNQTLSEQRARALAGWFRKQGFSGEIWYQGFGEDGQAVQTGDEVDQQANRRALYFVAADPPPRSRSLPGSSWKPL
jgi:outer membrane protein OmpA-like peptidoglycan-associated protein